MKKTILTCDRCFKDVNELFEVKAILTGWASDVIYKKMV